MWYLAKVNQNARSRPSSTKIRCTAPGPGTYARDLDLEMVLGCPALVVAESG